jgi:hypothetical protein
MKSTWSNPVSRSNVAILVRTPVSTSVPRRASVS